MVWPTLGSRTAKEQNRTEHDLTPRQREITKDVRRKALDELEREKEGESEGASSRGNYRIIVVGQQTMKPRAVKVPLRN